MKEEKILVVDDEEAIRSIILEILEDSLYPTDYAVDGIDALEKLKAAKYDLVLTDVKMPRLNGLGLLKEIKSKYPDIPVIILTGQGTMETAIKALKLGASDFITKPFEIASLTNTIENNLISLRLKRENIKLQNQILEDRDLLKKKVFELSVLRKLSVNFSYTFSFTELFNMIFKTLPENIDYDVSAILNIESGEINIHTRQSISDKLLVWLKDLMLNEISKIYKHNLKIEHFKEKFTSEKRIVKDTPKVKSYFNTILWIDKKPFGVLNISSFEENAFSKSDKEFINNLAEQSSNIFSRLKYVMGSQREKLQFIIDNLPDGVIMYDTNDNSILINPRAKSMISRREIREITKTDIEKRLNLDFLLLRKETENNLLLRKEMKLNMGDDDIILEANISNLENPDGLTQGLVMVFRDVTAERKLDQLKKEFISNVSHELRTPTATIKEFISILNDEIGGPLTNEQREFTEIMSNNIDRLLRLIDNLLSMSRSDSGDLKVDKDHFDLNARIRKYYPSFKMQLKKKNIKLKLKLPENTLEIFADPDSVIQMLTNLIDNAMKYSFENTEVTIGVEDKNSDVLIWVKDQGRGIHPEKHEDIFKRFYRIESKKEARQQGAGLGLPIIKELVKLHNGKIEVDSDIDKGTTFFITLPKNRE